MRWIDLGLPVLLASAAPALAAVDCRDGPIAAAAANAASLESLEWLPFRRPERGWAIYATSIATEIGTRCAAVTPAFASALAAWQGRNALPPSGILDPASFAVMSTRWTLARPFVIATRNGACPSPPPPKLLATAAAAESYGGKTIQLRADALAAYRRMIVSARQSQAAREPLSFLLFSGFRDPGADDARCLVDGNCQGVVRAACSAHRTGLALDLHVGNAAGFGPDSSDDGNRRAMVKTLAYRWLVTNAARFGFVNYVFEPWHWEWSPPAPPNAKPQE
jgi:hypothetical protein